MVNTTLPQYRDINDIPNFANIIIIAYYYLYIQYFIFVLFHSYNCK